MVSETAPIEPGTRELQVPPAAAITLRVTDVAELDGQQVSPRCPSH